MKRILLGLALLIATGVSAQPASRPPVAGPNQAPGGRGDLWQLLTPDQREQLWRSLSPEQRADLWRGLEPGERFEMRQRLGPMGPQGAAGPWAHRRGFERGDSPPIATMTPEERRQMREQIREAHRTRREKMEAERARRPE
jgi:hypothetical protein